MLRKGHPWHSGPGENVNVRPDVARIVERSGADVAHPWSGVLTEDGDLTARTAKDPLGAAVVARSVDRTRLSLEDLHPVSLDQQVDDERAAGLALAVQAVTAMDEHRLRNQPVSNASARASALAISTHATDAKRGSRQARANPWPTCQPRACEGIRHAARNREVRGSSNSVNPRRLAAQRYVPGVRGLRRRARIARVAPRSSRITAAVSTAAAFGAVLAVLAARAAASPVIVTGCDQIIGSQKSPFQHRYQVVLGRVDVPVAISQKAVSADVAGWRYWSKAGLIVQARSGVVTVTVPAAWRRKAAVSWGNGYPPPQSRLRIASCPPRPDSWNAYAGGFYIRTRTACVPLTFHVGGETRTVTVSIGRRCGRHH